MSNQPSKSDQNYTLLKSLHLNTDILTWPEQLPSGCHPHSSFIPHSHNWDIDHVPSCGVREGISHPNIPTLRALAWPRAPACCCIPARSTRKTYERAGDDEPLRRITQTASGGNSPSCPGAEEGNLRALKTTTEEPGQRKATEVTFWAGQRPEKGARTWQEHEAEQTPSTMVGTAPT